MMAIVDGHPRSMDLLTYCDCYIQHQLDVITRRSAFRFQKDTARLAIVTGLIKAASIINEVIAVIRSSTDKADSKVNLEAKYAFTEPQAEAIVMMPLYKLSHTDISVLEAEKTSLEKDLAILDGLLHKQDQREDLIIADLTAIAKEYGGKRLTEVREGAELQSATQVDKRDLIAQEDVYVVATRDGYLKRSSIKSWKGSGGQNGARPGIKAGDGFIFNALASTTDFMLHLALDHDGSGAFSIDLCEMTRPGNVTYSVDTVHEFQKRYPNRELYWLLGADEVNSFPKWKAPEEIAKAVQLVYVPRPGVEVDPDIVKKFQMLRLDYALSGSVSSSAVRNLGSIDVPFSVLDYIEKNHLYFMQSLRAISQQR